MNIKLTTSQFTAIAAALFLVAGPQSAVTPAYAVDDDVEVICWDRDDGVLECETVENLKAECALSDPDNESEMCSDVNENNGRGSRAAIFTSHDDDGGDGGHSQRKTAPNRR